MDMLEAMAVPVSGTLAPYSPPFELSSSYECSSYVLAMCRELELPEDFKVAHWVHFQGGHICFLEAHAWRFKRDHHLKGWRGRPGTLWSYIAVIGRTGSGSVTSAPPSCGGWRGNELVIRDGSGTRPLTSWITGE